MRVTKALLSVSDKEGIADFGKGLSSIGIQIISTGGTATFLKKAGIKVTEISILTGFPELLDGRVKTLHPVVHGGILAKRTEKNHMEMLKKYNISTIDLVACNLYPFETTIQKENVMLKILLVFFSLIILILDNGIAFEGGGINSCDEIIFRH